MRAMRVFERVVRLAQRLRLIQMREQQRLQGVDVVGQLSAAEHSRYFTKYGVSIEPQTQ
jgi:hypothetical protein